MRALSHAILAPNPHNRQPWLVELKGDDTVILLRDETRDLPETDPYNRQIFIGLGCFLEQLTIAASADGYALATTLFPEGETGPVAIAKFTQGGTADPLAQHILTRHCDKGPYSDHPIPATAVTALSSFATIITEPTKVANIQSLSWDAFKVETFTPRTLKESVDLMRAGKREINANPDGIELQGALFDLGRISDFITNDLLMDTNHPTFQGVLDEYDTTLHATPAYAVINTDGNTRTDQITAGRQWLRLQLTATANGLGMQPISQALQEYPEMADLYAKAHQMLARDGQTVQMLGRLGYGTSAIKTPRWPLETRLINET